MKSLLSRLRRIPARWRWASLALMVVVIGFAVWFFFLRGGGGPTTVVQQPPPRPALGKVVTFSDYQRAVEDARDDVAAARSTSGDERKRAVQKAISDLGRVEGASVMPPGPDGKPGQVDNTLILGELGRDEPNLVAVDAALSALSNNLAAAPAEMQGILAGGPAIAALNNVLSDPIFDYARSETPLQRLARWLAGLTGQADPGDTLWRWFLSIVAGLAGGTLVYLATYRIRKRWARLGVSALGGLAIAVLFYYATDAFDLTIKVLGALGLVVAAVAVALLLAGMNRASSPASVRAISELAQVLGMSAVEARQRAEASAEAGDYRSAIRYRCLAVLLALDEAGMLTFDRTATNREYLFRAPDTVHDDLQPLLDRFDQIWYGDSPTNAQEWQAYDAKAASIEARVAAQLRAQSKAA